MRGRKSYKRFACIGVAIVLVVGIGVASVLIVRLSRSPSPSPRTVPDGDRREAGPIVADLVTAIRKADTQAIRHLLDNSADVNARDAEGNTPLILASFYASPQCVKLLIERGAEVNAANRAGAAPLIRAATSYEKTRLLLTAGGRAALVNDVCPVPGGSKPRPPIRVVAFAEHVGRGESPCQHFDFACPGDLSLDWAGRGFLSQACRCPGPLQRHRRCQRGSATDPRGLALLVDQRAR
jgi:hypothetical protein